MEPPGPGSSNFQFTVPVVSLPGRGLPLSVNLTYNSRVWTVLPVQSAWFDLDPSWLSARGFGFPFVRLVSMGGISNEWMVVEPDGTRHPYRVVVNTGTQLLCRTTDGSFIDYTTSLSNDPTPSMQAKFPNGTVVDFELDASYPSAGWPVRITDPNGNYITITYNQPVNGVVVPGIDTIADSMGRHIVFMYDRTRSVLTAIQGPDLNGRFGTLVRFTATGCRLTPGDATHPGDVGFAGIPWTRIYGVGTSGTVLKAVYYPATNTGYWFGETTSDPSYSSYCMLRRVVEQRGMSFTGDLNSPDMGIINSGQTTRERHYNYTPVMDVSLSDAPNYTQMDEQWWTPQGMLSASTTYNVSYPAGTRRLSVTYADRSRVEQDSVNSTGSWNDGLLADERFFATDGTTQLRGTHTEWSSTQDAPVRTSVTTSDLQSGEVLFLDYREGWRYNQPNSVDNKQGSVSGPSLRYVKFTYLPDTAPQVANRHIYNLIQTQEVFDSSGAQRVRLAETDYAYDDYSVTPLGACDAINNASVDNSRGNVTSVKRYVKAADNPPSNPITETRSYDVTGNMLTSNPSCCEQIRYTYNSDTRCAYPTSRTRGSATDPNVTVTTAAEYDFNTGVITATIDANNQRTQFDYLPGSGRLQKQTLPTGGSNSFSYDDVSLSVTAIAKVSDADPNGSQIKKLLTGRGQLTRQEVTAPVRPGCSSGCLDIVEMRYDNMGRLSQQCRPFPETVSADSDKKWTTYAYDSLGRAQSVTEPLGDGRPVGDNSVTQMFYNEPGRPGGASGAIGHTMRVRDTWGRERWSLTDVLGRVVEVAEPNPSGTGGLTPGALFTDYLYDGLDNLTDVVQGPQHRRFRYDSLRRLTQQKLAEKQGTLDELGNYIGGNNGWSDVFTYDNRSNLTSRKDARGVTTQYLYNNDPLNRVQSIHFDTANLQDVVLVGDIIFQYRSGAQTDLTQLLQVSFGATPDFPGGQESYGYDGFGRSTTKTVVLSGLAGYPQTITYGYDNLNRIPDMTYPSQYGLPANPRRAIHRAFDVESRASGIQVDSIDYASSISYNNASQVTSLNVGPSGPLQITENYNYDSGTGLLTRQIVQRSGVSFLDLGYGFYRPSPSVGATGQLTSLLNNLNANGNVNYAYDAMGRLSQGGNAPAWTQSYTYDAYGNRTSVATSGTPAEDLTSLTYDVQSNRIVSTTDPSVLKERFRYDAAGRLAAVYNDAGQLLETYGYGAGRQRLMTKNYVTGVKKYQFWNGDAVIAEYIEQLAGPTTWLQWSKSYIHMGTRLLSTLTLDATSTSYTVQFHHSDRLGTRLISHGESSDVQEKWTLPFGTGATCAAGDPLCFTSYQRSTTVALDYAENRNYHFSHGRFIQADPIGMAATNLRNPQSFNLYAYVGNDPVNKIDPTGNGCQWWDFYGSQGQFIGSYGLECSGEAGGNSAQGGSRNQAAGGGGGGGGGSGNPAPPSKPPEMCVGSATPNPKPEEPSLVDQLLDAILTNMIVGDLMGRPRGQLVGQVARDAASGAKAAVGAAREAEVGMYLYRNYGGKAQWDGQYWVGTNPNSVANYRQAAGLYDPVQGVGGVPESGNTGQFVVEGYLKDVEGVRVGMAQSGPKGPASLIEVIVPNPRTQIDICRVSGANPPF